MAIARHLKSGSTRPANPHAMSSDVNSLLTETQESRRWLGDGNNDLEDRNVKQ